MICKLTLLGIGAGICVAAQTVPLPGGGYAEWTFGAALIAIVLFLIFKTLPKRDEEKQATIALLTTQGDSLSKSFVVNSVALEKLSSVVSTISDRQASVAAVVELNQKVQELHIKHMETLQVVVTEIMRTLVDAREMMKPVPELRKEQNDLLKGMLETLKKESADSRK